MAATVRIARIQLGAGQATATVRVSRVSLATGPGSTPISVTVKVARMRFVTGNPQTPNNEMYVWDGSALRSVVVGRWTGSTIEQLSA